MRKTLSTLLLLSLCLSLLLGGCSFGAARGPQAPDFFRSLYPEAEVTVEEDGSLRLKGPDYSLHIIPEASPEAEWNPNLGVEPAELTKHWLRLDTSSVTGIILREPRISGISLYALLDGQWWPIPFSRADTSDLRWICEGRGGSLAIPLTIGRWQALPEGDYRILHRDELRDGADFSMDFRLSRSGDSLLVHCSSCPDGETVTRTLTWEAGDEAEPGSEQIRLRLNAREEDRPAGWQEVETRVLREADKGRTVWEFRAGEELLRISWRELNGTEVELMQAVLSDTEEARRIRIWSQDFREGESVAVAYQREDHVIPDAPDPAAWYVFYAESPGRDYPALLELLEALELSAYYWESIYNGWQVRFHVPA